MAPPLLGPALFAVLFAAGLAWEECVLLMAASMAALRIELLLLRCAAPQEGWRLGLRCLAVGCGGLIGAFVLAAALVTLATLGWEPNPAHLNGVVALIAGVGSIIALLQGSFVRFVSEAMLWVFILVAAAVSLDALDAVAGVWACAATGIGILCIVWTSWRLARDGAELLRFD